ncbi:MAG: M23 family metallopeptidase [Clostridium sp.]|nr:M23 family metallopeptidase [Clostridium sp.]
MRKNRKTSIKKERIIMITSSALVLAALTMTGVYVKNQSAQVENDGYRLDFSALEESPADKYEEITQNAEPADMEKVAEAALEADPALDNDLDYAPPVEEVGSGVVEIPGLTDGKTVLSQEAGADLAGNTPMADEELAALEEAAAEATAAEAAAEAVAETAEEDSADMAANSQTVEVVKALHFPQNLIRPSAGEVLIPFSMDKSVYFATLDVYKYHPAVVLAAVEGDPVTACADGKVAYGFQNEEIGNGIVLELGDGYQAIYGQLRDMTVTDGGYINAGEVLGFVAAPTKYYSVEGTNIFFQLQKNGVQINPEEYFR